MTPWALWRIYRRASKVGNLLQEAKVTKSLWVSKVFWFNVLTAAAELAQVLPIPAGTALLVTNAINIGLRLITDKGVTVIPGK